MATLDIVKRYRISTQLAGMLAKVKNIREVVTGIDFSDPKTQTTIRLNPIILHVKDKKITVYMPSEFNRSDINFSNISSEWFEFIEASVIMILGAYLNRNFS